MRRHDQIPEVEKALTRQRMMLEQLRIHLEGLAPNTPAAAQAAHRVAEEARILRTLEEKKYMLRRQAGLLALH